MISEQLPKNCTGFANASRHGGMPFQHSLSVWWRTCHKARSGRRQSLLFEGGIASPAAQLPLPGVAHCG